MICQSKKYEKDRNNALNKQATHKSWNQRNRLLICFIMSEEITHDLKEITYSIANQIITDINMNLFHPVPCFAFTYVLYRS